LSEVLAPFAFFLLSVHRVADVEYLTKVDCARRSEVLLSAIATGSILEVIEVLLQGVNTGRHSTRATNKRGGKRRRVCGGSSLVIALADPRVVQELLDIVSLVGSSHHGERKVY
jgi:hypothetical protein